METKTQTTKPVTKTTVQTKTNVIAKTPTKQTTTTKPASTVKTATTETKIVTTNQKPVATKTIQTKVITKTVPKTTSVPAKTTLATKTVVTKQVTTKTATTKSAQTKPTAKTTTPIKTTTQTKVVTTKTPATQKTTTQKVEKKAQTEEQKTKNAIELIGIFKKLEKNLVDVLQDIPQNVEDEGKESVLADIKSFKTKVDLARKIFDEYENTSNLIAQMIEAEKNDKESIEISKKVIEPTDKSQKSKINEKDLFKQVQSMEKQSNGLDKIEIEAVGDTVVVKKKSILGREPELRKN